LSTPTPPDLIRNPSVPYTDEHRPGGRRSPRGGVTRTRILVFHRSLPDRRVALGVLFVTAMSTTWAVRWLALEEELITLHEEGISVLEPTEQISGRSSRQGDEWVPHELSRPWEAPPLPVRVGGEPVARSETIAPPNTPAADVDRWARRLSVEQLAETRASLERMGRYEPLIHHALRERGLPTDLLYVALIESGFSPRATSRAGAAGIWQFMPETARAHGLEISDFVDERRDPVRSTYAAVRHLEWLHRQFGSWHLAAAAYNAGGGRVDRRLREVLGARGGDETLYWRIRSVLPDETREYVPKLLAATRIARYPALHGVHDLTPRAPLRFRELTVGGGVPLAEVAARLGVGADELVELNPHLIRGATPPGRRWPVRVPVELPGMSGPLSAR
jgi:hypothetical protein